MRAGPLRDVVTRGPLAGRVGWRDTLSCGHNVAYDGVDHKQRRCPECEHGAPAQSVGEPLAEQQELDL